MTEERRGHRTGKARASGRRGLNPGGSCIFAYSMLASRLLLGQFLYGGVLCLCVETGRRLLSALLARGWGSPGARLRRAGLLAAAVLMYCLLPAFSPIEKLLEVAGLILCLQLGAAAGRAALHLKGKSLAGTMLAAGAHLAAAAGAAAILLASGAPAHTVWILAAGCALCAGVSLASQLCPDAEREKGAPLPETETAFPRTYAGRVHGLLSASLMMLLHMGAVELLSLAAVYGDAETVLLYAVLAAAAAVCARAGVRVSRAGRARRSPDVPLTVLAGLLLLACALAPLCRAADGIAVWLAGAAFFGTGAFLCASGLFRMEASAERAAVFAGLTGLDAYKRMRREKREWAALAGQALALVPSVILGISRREALRAGPGQTEMWRAAAADAPLLFLLPPLLLLLASLILTLRFPVTDRTAEKINRYMGMAEDDPCRPALRAQLEDRLLRRHSQSWGIRFIRGAIRVLYPTRTLNPERVRPDDENPVVFLSNHGELFGPVACVCSLPVPVRPWTIDRMMDAEIGADYLYRYTYSHQHFIPPFLRRPVADFMARLSVWCMRSLDCVPVYRDKPAQLMKTFRLSVAAMACGDSLLIFPENPNAVSYEHGYEREGVGELFSGFAMLAAIYYGKTGKRCRFLPVFADKDSRTVSVGEEILYDPEADAAVERERISREAYEQMNAMYLERKRQRSA